LRESALILVIERDPHVRELQRYFLEQAGFTVEFAENGSVAVDQARERLPTILISEILVPGLDGLSVCRTLKADRRTRAITVLIFSILAARERALEAGADAFLKKPLNDETLVQTVEMLLLQPAKGGAAHGTH
jgi:DNA-binding response OmpR family regulator